MRADPKMQASERRDQPRAAFGRLSAYYGEARFGAARVTELSETGLRLQDAQLPLHAEVQLSIPLPDRRGRVRPCRALGKVVRREGTEVGLELRPLLPLHLLQLRDYVWRSNSAR